MTAPAPPKSNCAAVTAAGIVPQRVCELCGYQWDDGAPPPGACDPITFKTVADRACSDVVGAEAWLAVALQEKGKVGDAVDVDAMRRVLAERKVMLRVLDAVEASRDVKDLLNARKQPRAGADRRHSMEA